MPAEYSLRYLPAAEEDLLSILEYIAKDSPDVRKRSWKNLTSESAFWKHLHLPGEYLAIRILRNLATEC